MVHDTTTAVVDALGEGVSDPEGDRDTTLEVLVDGAGGQEIGRVDDLVRDDGDTPGWAVLLDVDDTPHVRFVGQFVGVAVTPGTSDADARQLVRERRGWRRGTPAAIRSSAKTALIGSRRVELVERDGGAYLLTVQVYDSEVEDVTDVQAAVDAEKPTGIVVTVDVLAGATWQHMIDNHGPTHADFAAEFPTHEDAITHVPE